VFNWFFGAIAEVSFYLARFHERRAGELIVRARRANEAAERCSLVQQWADGDEPWSVIAARGEQQKRYRVPFVATVLEGPR